jgi:hypothetical protein
MMRFWHMNLIFDATLKIIYGISAQFNAEYNSASPAIGKYL